MMLYVYNPEKRLHLSLLCYASNLKEEENFFQLQSIYLLTFVTPTFVNLGWAWRFNIFRNFQPEFWIFTYKKLLNFPPTVFEESSGGSLRRWSVLRWLLSSSASCQSVTIFDVVKLENPWARKLSLFIFSLGLYLIDEDYENSEVM